MTSGQRPKICHHKHTKKSDRLSRDYLIRFYFVPSCLCVADSPPSGTGHDISPGKTKRNRPFGRRLGRWDGTGVTIRSQRSSRDGFEPPSHQEYQGGQSPLSLASPLVLLVAWWLDIRIQSRRDAGTGHVVSPRNPREFLGTGPNTRQLTQSARRGRTSGKNRDGTRTRFTGPHGTRTRSVVQPSQSASPGPAGQSAGPGRPRRELPLRRPSRCLHRRRGGVDRPAPIRM